MKRRTVSRVEKTSGDTPRGHGTASKEDSGKGLGKLARAIGNQATHKLINSPVIQGKLKVSSPTDTSEHEADRVADSVMRMPDPPTSQLQRMCSDCEDEVQREVSAPEATPSAPTGAGDPTLHVSPQTQSQIEGLSGRGQPLPESARSYFEPRFGQDFGDVRVHTGAEGANAARAVNARAFTVGKDVAFATGEYSPETNSGRKLLAHELTHTLQQTGSGTAHLQRTIGDGHDLQSPRFAGDVVLEACFDNERLLRSGNTGPAVSKVQQALVDAGFPLPSFGVDGIFGPETRRAVQDYQRARGLVPDGLVGPITMGALDAEFAAPGPGPAPPGPGPAPPGPGPAPPGPGPAPPGPGPAPPGPGPAPAPDLRTDLQAFVTANNSTYLTYKTRILAAPAAERAAALADQTLLRNMQGVLAANDFAKVVELLGRSAPTAGTMLGNATVSAEMQAAFTASNPAVTLPPHNPANPVGPCNPPAGTPPPAGVHEEGGWIYMNLITGDLTTRRAAPGGQANINLGGPPNVADSIVVGTFHTHPNVGPCWGPVTASGTDTTSANGTGVPWLIIGAFPDVATTQTTSTGPAQRLHLAGNRGFPGAAGGDAPQATLDGSFDEV